MLKTLFFGELKLILFFLWFHNGHNTIRSSVPYAGQFSKWTLALQSSAVRIEIE